MKDQVAQPIVAGLHAAGAGDPEAGGHKRENINLALRRHVEGAGDWDHGDLIADSHVWSDRLNGELRLGVSVPALRVKRMPRRTLGTYRQGANDLGLPYEVTLNERHLDRPLAVRVLILFHELLHCWQELFGRAGKNNYHNRQFRDKAASFGVIVDERGRTAEVLPGAFLDLLARHGVDAAPLLKSRPEERDDGGGGKSKMIKWSCNCTNVRAAVELRARCLKCECEFERAGA